MDGTIEQWMDRLTERQMDGWID